MASFRVRVHRADCAAWAVATLIVTASDPDEALRQVLRVAHWLGAPMAAGALQNGSTRLGMARADLVPGVTLTATEHEVRDDD